MLQRVQCRNPYPHPQYSAPASDLGAASATSPCSALTHTHQISFPALHAFDFAPIWYRGLWYAVSDTRISFRREKSKSNSRMTAREQGLTRSRDVRQILRHTGRTPPSFPCSSIWGEHPKHMRKIRKQEDRKARQTSKCLHLKCGKV